MTVERLKDDQERQYPGRVFEDQSLDYAEPLLAGHFSPSGHPVKGRTAVLFPYPSTALDWGPTSGWSSRK